MKRKGTGICLLMVVCVLFATSVFAKEIVDTKVDCAVYIQSAACPAEYIDYAESNIERFLNGTELPNDMLSGKFELGQPFSFINEAADIFYFPVLCDGEIVFLFRIFPLGEGGYSGILSSMLADKINTLCNKSSIETPAQLSMVDNKIVASVGDEVYIWHEYSVNDIQNDSEIVRSKTSPKTVVEITNPSMTIEIIQNFSSRSADSCYLGNDNTISETQAQKEQWCMAYAEAWVMRFIKGDNTSATQILKHIHDRVNEEDAISDSQAIIYANYRGVYPIDHNSKLSNDLLIAELVNGRPVIYTVQRMTEGSHAKHALVLRGYDGESGTWSIWNPWYDVYETMDMGGAYVPYLHTDRLYRYCDTMTNWQ